jgi:hypothetical protein
VAAGVLLGLAGAGLLGEDRAPAQPVLRSGPFALDAPKGVTLASAAGLGEGTPVRLGDREALRTQAGDRVRFAFLAQEGVATVTCDAVPAKACEAAAASLRGGTPARITPDPAYAKALSAALAGLTANVEAAQARFRARRSAGRANAVARAYGSAALPAPPLRAKAAAKGLGDALARLSVQWGRMAGSVADRGRFRAAGEAIRTAEARAERALAAFTSLGYGDPAR